ncbi:hypothetical protein HYS11_00755 [Candidatus Gottesmanbacteria bacterium]|nr:hypothetical protein [Candidatus Gottesmanbacteria bacterium]
MDLNSLGLASAIQKVSAGDRSTIHQSGYSRAAQNVGMHMGVDFATSSQGTTPIPALLKRGEVAKTNLEIVNEAIDNKNNDLIRQALPLLYPKDLASAYNSVTHLSGSYDETGSQKQERVGMLQTFHAFFTQRLLEAGHTKEEVRAFFLLTQNFGMTNTSFSAIATPDDLVQTINDFPQLIDSGKFDTMHQLLFGKRMLFQSYDDGYLSRILYSLKSNLYDSTLASEPHKIPVTAGSLITVLVKINQLYQNDEFLGTYTMRGEIENLFAEVLQTYITRVYKNVDVNQHKAEIEAFFTKAKQAGIPVDSRKIVDYTHDEREKTLAKMMRDVFSERSTDFEQRIDQFFEEFIAGEGGYDQDKIVGIFLKEYRELLDEKGVSDEERFKYAQYFNNKLQNYTLAASYDLNDELGLGLRQGSFDTNELYDRLRKLHLNVIASIVFFKEDGPLFYQHLTELMGNSGIHPQELQLAGLVNICSDLLNVNTFAGFKVLRSKMTGHANYVQKVTINHYDQFLQTPFIREIVQQSQAIPPFESMSDYLKYVDSVFGHGIRDLSNRDLFGDNIFPLVFGDRLRDDIVASLENGISSDDYQS